MVEGTRYKVHLLVSLCQVSFPLTPLILPIVWLVSNSLAYLVVFCGYGIGGFSYKGSAVWLKNESAPPTP